MKEITIDALESILKNLIERLRKKDINELSFDNDWYWNIPTESLSSFPTEPSLTVGSLNDDVDFLNSLVKEDFTTDFLELERLAALFKFMSKKFSSSLV
ncbi:hypothetical protein [Longitalea luteola]|uniref:hypothetical protein n=1 Tax=Longitalea luteola TaxID=2812563 RepID=UPI001A95CB97|nr:hypothetical protein [Longitalea luteola]